MALTHLVSLFPFGFILTNYWVYFELADPLLFWVSSWFTFYTYNKAVPSKATNPSGETRFNSQLLPQDQYSQLPAAPETGEDELWIRLLLKRVNEAVA